MVGNDVVDLDDPETAAEGLNPRFDARVFSNDELERIAAAEDSRRLRWTLWAAKESAYKLCKRKDATAIFAHARFETALDDSGHGYVRLGDWTCAVQVTCQMAQIHAVATAEYDDRKRVVSCVQKISRENDPSLKVRRLAIESVARSIGIDRESVTITTGADRVPRLHLDGSIHGFLSLSHHGSLVAFAWMPAR